MLAGRRACAAGGCLAGTRFSSKGQSIVGLLVRNRQYGKAAHLVGIVPLLQEARDRHYAVGAFNYCNFESAQAIVETASELRAPVILITGPWELPLLGARTLATIAESVAAQTDVPVCLHLDHGDSIEMARECIEAGFPSVMIDVSHLPFEENVRITRTVTEMAHSCGVTVEGELGAVGMVDDSTVEGHAEASLTEPDRAAEFVELTGVDALACAIGNAHGIYPQRPVLDFERLQAIQEAVGDTVLVLHGGSGTHPDQLHKAIEIGIAKVNVATELSRAYVNAICEAQASKNGKAWWAHALVDAKGALKPVVERWMRQIGCVGACPASDSVLARPLTSGQD